MHAAHLLGFLAGAHTLLSRARARDAERAARAQGKPCTSHYVTVARPINCLEVATVRMDAATPALALDLGSASANSGALPRPSVVRVQSRGEWSAIACEPILGAASKRFPCSLGTLLKLKRGATVPPVVVAQVGQCAFAFGIAATITEADAIAATVSRHYPGAFVYITRDARTRVHGDAGMLANVGNQVAAVDEDLLYHDPA